VRNSGTARVKVHAANSSARTLASSLLNPPGAAAAVVGAGSRVLGEVGHACTFEAGWFQEVEACVLRCVLRLRLRVCCCTSQRSGAQTAGGAYTTPAWCNMWNWPWSALSRAAGMHRPRSAMHAGDPPPGWAAALMCTRANRSTYDFDPPAGAATGMGIAASAALHATSRRCCRCCRCCGWRMLLLLLMDALLLLATGAARARRCGALHRTNRPRGRTSRVWIGWCCCTRGNCLCCRAFICPPRAERGDGR